MAVHRVIRFTQDELEELIKILEEKGVINTITSNKAVGKILRVYLRKPRANKKEKKEEQKTPLEKIIKF
ncbi:MAG: hypothetical protein QW197_03500 [Candidatus Aenigmatarchaeota archaeon]